MVSAVLTNNPKEPDMNIRKQVLKATIEAEGARRLFSDLADHFVRNGQGMLSQRHLAEILAKRAAA